MAVVFVLEFLRERRSYADDLIASDRVAQAPLIVEVLEDRARFSAVEGRLVPEASDVKNAVFFKAQISGELDPVLEDEVLAVDLVPDEDPLLRESVDPDIVRVVVVAHVFEAVRADAPVVILNDVKVSKATRDHVGDAVLTHLVVRVQERDELARRFYDAVIPCHADAPLCRVVEDPEADAHVVLVADLRAPVSASVVDDDDLNVVKVLLVHPDRVQAPLQVGAFVIDRDDNAQFSHFQPPHTSRSPLQTCRTSCSF